MFTIVGSTVMTVFLLVLSFVLYGTGLFFDNDNFRLMGFMLLITGYLSTRIDMLIEVYKTDRAKDRLRSYLDQDNK